MTEACLQPPALAALLAELTTTGRHDDPVGQFYEAFLAAHDGQQRATRGVYYTPKPVVQYLVRSVDVLLRREFGLPAGLADPGDSVDWHVLDPAVGAGTFLLAVIEWVYQQVDQPDWPKHACTHLLPRLHGQEILLAAYAAAHLRIASVLVATGCPAPMLPPLAIDLCDTLAGPGAWPRPNVGNRQVVCVLGNPPYANFGGSRPSQWMHTLLHDYKAGLDERKINLDDACIQFIRYAQWQVEQAGAGMVAFVTSRTFLAGLTHRALRQALLTAFSTVYILDLHGDHKTKIPGDENVFEILQGVTLVVMVRTFDHRGSAQLFHAEIHGTRASKDEILATTDVSQTQWRRLTPETPHFFFVPKSHNHRAEFASHPSLRGDIFIAHNTGIQTKRDRLVYHFDRSGLDELLEDLRTRPGPDIICKYKLPPDGRDWRLSRAIHDVQTHSGQICRVLYRPLDWRWTWFSGHSRGLMAYPRSPLMRSALRPNLLLLTVRNARRGNCDSFFVADTLVDKDAVSPLDNASFFPLWAGDAAAASLNLNPEFLARLGASLGVAAEVLAANPEQVFYYIYALVHAPSYRDRYADVLPLEFARIPLTRQRSLYASLCDFGERLVAWHTWRSREFPGRPPTPHGNWTNPPVAMHPRYTAEVVHIADGYGFSGVSQRAWSLQVGGTRVLERWLRQRSGRTLTAHDRDHVSQLMAVLEATAATMSAIDDAIANHGGWPLR